ncbi:acyltransferase 3 [Minicystis rosea]|nr:acyltransferase 3 [Minicystis rosea]
MPLDETDSLARHTAYLRTAHFPSLDGLRCLSIVPVVWHHATSGPIDGILGKGPVGVDLFFAISGFLITTRMLDERAATGTVALGPFYLRRSLRIFPLYYAVLALHVARAFFLLPDGPQRAHFFRSLPYWATYTANWFVDFDVPHPVIFAFGWSLATEEQFYAIWPLVVRTARGAAVPVVTALLLLLVDQGIEHGLFLDLPPLARRMLASIASPICMGALLAYALRGSRSFAAMWTLLGHRVSAPLVLFAVMAMLHFDSVPLVAVQLGLVLLVGACTIRPDHGLRALTDAAPVRFIGTVSYGIYLIHVSMITLARGVLPSAWRSPVWVFLSAFALTLAVAAASHRWFEQPFVRLRHRFGRRQLNAA